MANGKFIYLIFSLVIGLAQISICQKIPYNPSLNITTDTVDIASDGYVEYTTTNTLLGDARFTLFGDGYFSIGNSFGHQFPANTAGFTTITYFNRRYKKKFPTKREKVTGPTGLGTSTNKKIRMPNGVNSRVGTSWSPSLGIENYFLLIFENTSAVIDTGCIEFYYDSTQLILNNSGILEYNWVSNKQKNSVSKSTLYNSKISWEFETLMPGEQRVVYIPMTSAVSAGTILNVGSKYNSGCSGGGSGAAGVSGSATTSRGWPHDPNTKTADKVCVRSDTIDQYLTYMITFQNEGTAPAVNVKVVDVLNVSHLNPSTIEYLDSEYSCNFTVNGNILEINFPNINLPGEKQTNPEINSYDLTESWVKFKICTKPDLQDQDTIRNHVDIYFDSQPPVRTDPSKVAIWDCQQQVDVCEPNQKITSTVESKTAEFSVNPNPTENVIFIEGLEDQKFNVTIYNARGEVVKNKEGLDRDNNSMDLENLTSGLYFVNIRNEIANITKKVIKL